MQGQTRAAVIRDTWQRLSCFGLDELRVRQAIGLTQADLADEDAAWPSALRLRLWELALQAGAPDDVGLQAAQGVRLEDLGIAGHVARHSPTLGVACAALGRYGTLISQDDEFEHRLEGGLSVLSYDIAGPAEVRRHIVDNVLACYCLMLRQLCGPDLHPAALSLQRRAPQDRSAHARLFGCEVRFGCNENAIAYRREAFSRPVIGASPYLLGVLTRHAEALLQRSQAVLPWTRRVRRAVQAGLAEGRFSIGHVAQALHTPPRTLQRWLATEGQAFSAIVRQVQHDKAIEYMHEAGLPLSEIALRVGFSEASAFHRAFRQWTGATPQAYRNALLKRAACA